MATVQEKIELLHQKLDTIEMGGGQQKIDKQHEKGKMTARERLHMLFDEGSFTEISQFIHHRCTNFGMAKRNPRRRRRYGIRQCQWPPRLCLCRRFYRRRWLSRGNACPQDLPGTGNGTQNGGSYCRNQ